MNIRTTPGSNSPADPVRFALHLTKDERDLIIHQPMSDIGAATIARMVSDHFKSFHGAARAAMEGRLSHLQANAQMVRTRREMIQVEYTAITCNNPVSGRVVSPDSAEAASPVAEPSPGAHSRRVHRLNMAALCFGFALCATFVDWLLGYSFCRATILNNGGSPFEAAVCGFPFATVPWGVELGIFLRADPVLTKCALRGCGRLLILSAAVYGASFALDFALSRDGSEPVWYQSLSPYLPIFRLFGQLGIGSCVAFLAIVKGMILFKTSRGEELLMLMADADKELADLSATEKGIEGEINVWEATLSYFIASTQAESRKFHQNNR